MTGERIARRKPAIILVQEDHQKLSRLAEAFAVRNPATAEELFTELERARIVQVGRLPADTVKMGSTVRYATDSGEDRTVILVYPADADIAQGKVSIMTPIGTALIGLSKGQSIGWTSRDGKENRLTVEEVSDHSPAETISALRAVQQ